MNEITRIALDNEMDLILAHRQSMKLLELTGLSLPAQTTFATAVSEIARAAIDMGQESYLILSVSNKNEVPKRVAATIKDNKAAFINRDSEAYKYAKRVAEEIVIKKGETEKTFVEIYQTIPKTFRLDEQVLEKWIILFNTDPAVSPYEEIKRKNRQLVELSDKLKESEGEYRMLTNSLPLMILTLDKDMKVTYANEWMQRYTGHTVETLNDTNWREVLHPDDHTHMWHECEDNGECKPVTIERRLKNGDTNEYRWYTGIATPINDKDGQLQYWTVYLADIHAQKTIEQTLKDNKELKEAQVELEEKIEELHRSNSELEQFAFVASHDLQEPLRKITFYSDFLKRKYHKQLAEEGSGFIENITKATERMKLLINDILAYSTIHKDKRVFTLVDLNEIASEAVQDLEIAIQEKNARLNIAKLPTIEADRNQLKQVFENLLSNSIKYTAADQQPEITVYAETDEEYVSLYFKDNGIGFEEKYINRMFALFQRLHGKAQYGGTGIGLAICKKIVEIHHGEITAHSQLGEGATFIIKLPVKSNRLK